ncbi:sulfatase [Thalassotalea sp. PLHSN55]|uniref:sulfatase n=1 Tax=Thalassotalea sp. PLHSN55 TaxID=3435888 RepID=UPI003F83114A
MSQLLLFTIILVSLSVQAVAKAKSNAANNAPWNFLVIIVDDLGFMDITPNNPNSFYQTPALEKFAKQSVNFSNSYAANPVCSPSRAALMTGINPAKLHATDWFHHQKSKRRNGSFKPANSIDYLPASTLTLAEALPKHYQTSFIGKWHLGEDPKYWPENQGFDVNIGGWSAGSPAGGYFAPYKNPRLTQGPDGEYLTERLTNEAIELLKQQTQKQTANAPFLMVLSYYSVHNPLQAPKGTIAKYQNHKKPLSRQEEFATEQQIWPYAKQARKVRIQQNHPIYAAMVEEMDHNIGRILQHLEDSGLAENTVVFFTSDNGGVSTSEGHPTSNLPLRGGKGWAYEGGIKVPLLVRAPGLHQVNIKQSTPVIGMDIPATIYELANVDVKNIDGVSLLPLLKNTPQIQNRALYWNYPHYSNQGGIPAAAIRLGDYKLIQNLEDGSVSLYNLNKDIGELHDVSKQLPERTQKMLKMLKKWMVENKVQFLQAKKNQQPWSINQ